MNDADHRHAEDGAEDPEDFARTSKRAAPGDRSSSPHSDSDESAPMSGSFDPLPGQGFVAPPIGQGTPSATEGMGDGPPSSRELAAPPEGARTGGVTQAEPPSRLPVAVIIAFVLGIAAVAVWRFWLG